jgi:hypothetical protein
MFSAGFAKLGRFWAKGVANWRHPGPAALILIASFGLVSCAVSPVGDGSGGGGSPEAKREAVEQRAGARWNALIKGDFTGAYALLSPASREAVTFDQFRQRAGRIAYRMAKVESVDCGSEHCTVKLRITYDHRQMKGIQTPIEETWVFDRGQPWLVYRS